MSFLIQMLAKDQKQRDFGHHRCIFMMLPHIHAIGKRNMIHSLMLCTFCKCSHYNHSKQQLATSREAVMPTQLELSATLLQLKRPSRGIVPSPHFKVLSRVFKSCSLNNSNSDHTINSLIVEGSISRVPVRPRH